jgi:raffinose/stachyose/melibiose transport system substrate-binding protein
MEESMRKDARTARWLGTAGLAAALVLTAAACGDNGGVGGSSAAAQATVGARQTVTLNYWTWFPAQSTLQKSIDAFEKANPTIKINLREFTNTNYQTELPLALGGGQSLDVVGVQIAAMTNSVRKFLRPVSSWANYLPGNWKSRINPTMLNQAQKISSDDALYDIPMGSIGSAFLYSNQALLAKAGITSEPTTESELATDVAKIKATEPGVTPVTFSGEAWWQDEVFFTVADQIDPKLSDELYTGKVAWNSPQMVEALTAYQHLFSSGTLNTGTLSLNEADADDQFNSGKAAFLLEGSWDSSILSSSYRQANGISVSDVGATYFPISVPGGQPTARTYAEGGLAIPKSSTHVAQAAKFIQFMTMTLQGESTWAPDLVLVPSLNGYTVPTSVLTSPAARAGYATIQKTIEAGGSGRGEYSTNFTSDVLDNSLLQVARGQLSPRADAANLRSAWDSGRYPLQ